MVTPLILAAKAQRQDIVSVLLSKNARPSSKDKEGRSALFYASRQGNVGALNALLKKQASVNDGSLHEASRELHPDVVTALIKANHDINFTSITNDHGGRTPLQEMLLKSDGSKGGISRIEETIRALTKDKPLTEDDFFLALNNPKPVPLIGALRTCGLYTAISSHMVKKIEVNSEFEYYYSPTMYIHLGLTYGPPDQRNGLISELRTFGVRDQFYARTKLRQPANSIGAPAVVVEWEEKRIAQRQWQRHELQTRLQQNRQQYQMQNKKLKKKDIEALNKKEQQDTELLEAQFSQEDSEYAARDAEFQKELWVKANKTREFVESQAQSAGAMARKAFEDIQKRQQARNLEIQHGDLSERRERHMRNLMERRHCLFLAGIKEFSERERKIAGWDV